MHYDNLDSRTRDFMRRELDMDVVAGRLHRSERLTTVGWQLFPDLLKEAVCFRDDTWLTRALQDFGVMNSQEYRRAPSGVVTLAKVPSNASQVLAEGEFNRFYARGLCARAVADEVSQVEVYRGRTSSTPRPESVALEGKRFLAAVLLEDLRRHIGVEPALKLATVNSGLTVRLVS